MIDKSHCELLYKSVDLNNLRFCFKAREQRTHKGNYGKVLCVCGSNADTICGACDTDEAGGVFNAENRSGDLCMRAGTVTAMSGAALLSAKAALRTGSGLVRVCTHRENFAPVAANLSEATFILYDDRTFCDIVKTEAGKGKSCDHGSSHDGCEKVFEGLKNEIKNSDAILIGCGIGCTENSFGLVDAVVSAAEGYLILDADALNILAKNPCLWDRMTCEQRKRTVITPHPAEMARISDVSVGSILADPVKAAVEFSDGYGVTVLLKDHETVIAQGKTVYINKSGNAGMATAGSGDVLAGILVSMLGNKSLAGVNMVEKVALGAYLHGLAGDIAAEEIGEHSVIASDIIDGIPKVLKGKS